MISRAQYEEQGALALLVSEPTEEGTVMLGFEGLGDCLFGCMGVVGVFSLPEGCIVWPDVETQVLCWQHAADARTQGAYDGITLLQDLTDGWFRRWWEQN